MKRNAELIQDEMGREERFSWEQVEERCDLHSSKLDDALQALIREGVLELRSEGYVWL